MSSQNSPIPSQVPLAIPRPGAAPIPPQYTSTTGYSTPDHIRRPSTTGVDFERRPLPGSYVLPETSSGPHHPSPVTALAVSRDSNWAASGYQDGKIIVWNISRPTEVCAEWKGEPGSTVHGLTFSPRGDWLLSVHENGCIAPFAIGYKPSHSGEEETKVDGGPERLSLNATDNKALWVSPMKALYAVDWAPNGLRLAVCSKERLYIWNVNVLEHGYTFSPQTVIEDPGLTFVTFSPDSRLLAYGGARDLYCVHNFESHAYRVDPQCLSEPKLDRTILQAAFDAKGEHLIVLSDDDTVRIWDIRDRHALKTQYTMPDGKVLAISFSPGGTATLVASHGDHRQAFFSEWHVAVSPKNALRYRLLPGPTTKTDTRAAAAMSRARFSPDGSFIISGAWDGTVKLWEISLVSATSLEE